MPQNINLLERRRPGRLASPQVQRAALMLGLLATVGLLVYLAKSRDLQALRQDLVRAQAQSEHLQRAIVEVPSPDVTLSQGLANEEREVQPLEAVARTLSTGGLAHTTGFIAPLQAFGHTATEGVWLTGLSLDNRRGSLVVEGRALDASRVPAYLQTLKADPYFAGTTFSAIELTAGNPTSALAADRALKFRISTPTADVETASPGPSGRASASEPAGAAMAETRSRPS
jgi:Tfp pilus assembly protein PilN